MMRRRDGGIERGGSNGRRGGCEAQHSVHTNSTVSKTGAAPLPDEGRGGREQGLDREVVRKEGREGGREAGKEMDRGPEDEWRGEKCREEEENTVRG